MFVLGSDITIGNFRFNGANEINISRSLHSIVETASIKLPSIVRILNKGSVSPQVVITGKQFSEGDPVVIKLGYNDNLQTEFTGFVKRCSLSMPLEVECEGYSWLLRRNVIDKFLLISSFKRSVSRCLYPVLTVSTTLVCSVTLILH